MSGKHVLAIIVSEGNVKPPLTCLIRQTIRPEKVIVAIESFPQYEFAGERVGKAMRNALAQEHLERFTHLFRLDDDVLIEDDHLERSLELEGDLVGTGGYAMLIKLSAFYNLFEQYPIHPCEDSLIAHTFMNHGYSVHKSPCPITFYNPKKYPPRFYFTIGVFRYQIGFNPLSLLGCFRDKNGGNLVGLNMIHIWMGYLYAFLNQRFLHRKP